MYGTIARMRLKPGMEAEFREDMTRYSSDLVRGYVSTTVYRMDSDPNEVFMAVVFKDKASYVANAEDPKQDERYRAMLKFLDGEPEWHDGEIISSDARQ